MTVEQLFETKGVIGDEFYCPFYGEADPLPLTGNLLVTNGGHIETVEGVPVDDVPGERQWARILEITTDRMPSKVFEVVCDSGPGSPYGWSIYRAIRFANLFDGFDISPPPADEDSNVYARPPIQKRQRALNGRMRIVSPTR